MIKNQPLFNTKKNGLALRAFSLIEMMVAVGILVFIVSIILANHSKFNSSVLLGALAYDVALSVREAQVYGLSVREYAGEFTVGYGVRFSEDDSFVLFTDRDRSRSYTPGDATLNTYTLGRGHRVIRFCGQAGAVERCSDSGVPITHLDIVFVRPNPDAWITSNENVGTGYYTKGYIVVGSPSGATRTIEVVPTGQISVKNP